MAKKQSKHERASLSFSGEQRLCTKGEKTVYVAIRLMEHYSVKSGPL